MAFKAMNLGEVSKRVTEVEKSIKGKVLSPEASNIKGRGDLVLTIYH